MIFCYARRRVYLLQEYSQEAVSHVHKYLMKNEVPVNLFEVGHCLVTLSSRLRVITWSILFVSHEISSIPLFAAIYRGNI